MQEFEFTIVHTQGVFHAAANYLSTIERGVTDNRSTERLPRDGNILMQDAVEEIRIKGPDAWYEEISSTS